MKNEPNCGECAQGGRREKEENILYEDEESCILIPDAPSLTGHIQVQSKNHEGNLSELNAGEAQHLFHLANYTAASLFESLQAQGTNLILTEGFTPHVTVQILARRMDDGLNLQWQPKAVSPAEMDEVAQKIKDKMPLETKKMEEKPSGEEKKGEEKIVQIEKQLETVKDKIVNTPEKENYLLKQLERIP